MQMNIKGGVENPGDVSYEERVKLWEEERMSDRSFSFSSWLHPVEHVYYSGADRLQKQTANDRTGADVECRWKSGQKAKQLKKSSFFPSCVMQLHEAVALMRSLGLSKKSVSGRWKGINYQTLSAVNPAAPQVQT